MPKTDGKKKVTFDAESPPGSQESQESVSIDGEITPAIDEVGPEDEDDAHEFEFEPEFEHPFEKLGALESIEGVGIADILANISESLASIAESFERHNKLLFKLSKQFDASK